jgi:hypothetical protein
MSTPTGNPALPEASGCGEILSSEGYTNLAKDDLALVGFSLQPYDYPLLQEFVTNGVVCQWSNSGDVGVVIGQLPMASDNWEATRSELLSEGYTEEDSPVRGFLSGPDGEDESYPSRGFTYREPFVYYTSAVNQLPLLLPGF